MSWNFTFKSHTPLQFVGDGVAVYNAGQEDEFRYAVTVRNNKESLKEFADEARLAQKKFKDVLAGATVQQKEAPAPLDSDEIVGSHTLTLLNA